MKNEIKAKVLMDSVCDDEDYGSRVITISTQSPIYLDAEVEKHGNLASNTSSTRAIGFPVTKIHGEEPFIPDEIYKASGTMHGADEVESHIKEHFQDTLEELYKVTMKKLEPYRSFIHKQHLNRYISPFALQTKVITANLSSWENFIELRISEYAQPEIRELANCVKNAIGNSTPTVTHSHIPMVSPADIARFPKQHIIRLSAGRIARYSYGVTESTEKCIKSLERGNRLIELCHKSPYEHQLFLMHSSSAAGVTHVDNQERHYSGRIRGWVQARKLIWTDESL